MAESVKVKGLDELVKSFRKLEKSLVKEVQKEIGEAAKIVAEDARSRFAGIQPRSAASIRPRVRGARGFAEQRRRKTTGKRPDFGALQMRRAFVPALTSKQPEVLERMERMLDKLGGEAGF